MRPTPFQDDELTTDGFLGGQVSVLQPRAGYRAGVDPVLLAATIPAKPGQVVLELGCGGGVGLTCLGARVGGLNAIGVELQPAYAALARENLARNGQAGTIYTSDLSALPADLRQIQVHHVFANPPFFSVGTRSAAAAQDREIARAGATRLSAWVETAAKRLRPRGTATFIQRAERLPELLGAMTIHLGSVELWPIASREGRAPRLVLVRGVQSGKAAFRFHAPLILHEGDSHRPEGKSYTSVVRAVLAKGAALPFPT